MWPFKRKSDKKPADAGNPAPSANLRKRTTDYVFAKQFPVRPAPAPVDDGSEFVTGMAVGGAIGGAEGAFLGGMIGGVTGGIIGGEIAKMNDSSPAPDPGPVQFDGGDSGGAGASSNWEPCDASSSDSSSSYDSGSSSDCGSSDSGSSSDF